MSENQTETKLPDITEDILSVLRHFCPTDRVTCDEVVFRSVGQGVLCQFSRTISNS
jgi:hypothetical protein